MKRILYFIFLFYPVLIQAQSSNQILVPYREKNLWGYCDTNGKVIIKPAYDSASFIFRTDSYGEVYLNRKESYVSREGKLLFPFFDFIYKWNDQYVVVSNNNLRGLLDMMGRSIIPLEYHHFEYTNNYALYENEKNKLIAVKDQKYFLFDLSSGSSKEIVNPNQDSNNAYSIVEAISDTKENPKTQVQRNIKPQFPDSLKIRLDLDSVRQVSFVGFNEFGNLQFFKLYKNGKVGLWSKRLLIAPEFTEIEKIYAGSQTRIFARKKKKMGMIDEKGKEWIPFKYDSLIVLKDNVIRTVVNKKAGAVILNSSYPPISNKYDKLDIRLRNPVLQGWSFLIFRVIKNGKMGYVGENGVEYFKD